MESSISKFRYQETNLDKYFSDAFDCIFNHNIIEELTEKAVRLSKFERKLYFNGKLKNGFKSPISFTPLDFFNLFYHELDLIKQNTAPLSTISRLQSIKLKPFDRLYLYIKLIEVLRKDINNNLLIFQSNLIEKEYQIIFDIYLSKCPDFIKEELDDIIQTNNILLSLLPSISEKLKSLIEIKNNKEPFHNDPLINQLVYNHWLIPQINHYTELNKVGISTDNNSTNKDSLYLIENKSTLDVEEKTFADYLLHIENQMLAKALKNKFRHEKGKTIRIMIEALKELEIISIPDRSNKRFYKALSDFFSSEIGSYQAIFDYKIQKHDNPYILKYKEVINQIVKRLPKAN